MCCLFGLIDYGHSLSAKQKNHVLSALATAAEARGIDATGIAYNYGGKLRIYKRPWPGHLMRFRVPADAHAIMGHTRMATQGSARKAYNNHPFPGSVKSGAFAFAHNGMIHNDDILRRIKGLPETEIETDSYIGVQLIEQKKTLSFSSLRYMAEQLEGSFTCTVLDQQNNLYIIKGDNPFCLYHYPAMGVYLYASTEDILKRALSRIRVPFRHPESIPLSCGEILCIDLVGNIGRQKFNDSKLFTSWYDSLWTPYYPRTNFVPEADEYLEELKSVAMSFGYTPEDIEALHRQGFTLEELEEFLYGGEL